MASLLGRRQCLFCELRQLIAVRPRCLRAPSTTSIGISGQDRYIERSDRREYKQKTWNTTAVPGVQGSIREFATLRNLDTKSVDEPVTNPSGEISELAREISASTFTPKVLSEEEVLSFLQRLQRLANIVSGANGGGKQPQQDGSKENTATSALLDLRESPSSSRSKTSLGSSTARTISMSAGSKKSMTSELLRLSDEIMRNPMLFISPPVLSAAVSLHCSLRRAEYLPTFFTLYASKPIPRPNGNNPLNPPNAKPIIFHVPNPRSPKNAIPAEIAALALETAISQKELALCLSIIDTAFCTPSYYRSRILRKAGIPVAGLAMAPLAAYTLATKFAESYQISMDHSTATTVAFAAIVSYIGFTATIGVVALTTSNDQMVRVTWASGVPLRERWLREEERAALDKVAMAWGFKEEWKRGMETGAEWEQLREFIGRRGMVLDAANLMAGME